MKRNAKTVLSVFLAALFCMLTLSTASVAFAAGGAISSFGFDGTAVESENDIVYWWENSNNGKYYLFVPSTADLSELTVIFSATNNVYVGADKLTSGEKTAAFAAGGEFTLTCGRTSYTLVVLKSSNVPAMYITTESGSLNSVHADKNHKEAGNMLLVADGETEYNGELDYIKGRGNSTWTYRKRPYNIKLSSKTDLFGMGKAKAWCLIACYEEESLVRNKGVYDLSDDIGLYYSPNSRHIDLYVNNRYMGIYLLTEKVEVGSNRIDITDLEKLNEKANEGIDIESCELAGVRDADCGYKRSSSKWVEIPNEPNDISGGYLLEYEFANRYADEVSGFVSNQGQPIVVKAPEYASSAEVEYISSLYQEFEDAVFSETGYNSLGKYYTDYLDIDSMVKMYIIQELTMNLDAATTSFYLCKDAGSNVFCASPVWDFDYSLGKESSRLGIDMTIPTLLWASISQVPVNKPQTMFDNVFRSGVPSILNALCRHDDFMDLVAETWNDVFLPALDGRSESWTALSEEIFDSAVMESVRWQKYDTYDVNEVRTAYADNVKYVADFLDTRTEFLSSQFIKGALHVRYNANGGSGCTVDPYAYTANGITKVIANDFTREGYVFTGWNSEPDGSGYSYKVNDYIQLRKSTTLYAQWREETVFESFYAKIYNFFKQLISKILSFDFSDLFKKIGK